MIAELHKCPSLFATTADMNSIMVRMSTNAQELTFSVATSDGRSFFKSYSEEALGKIKDSWNDDCTWLKFFSSIIYNINRGQVIFENNVVTCGKLEEGVIKDDAKMDFPVSLTKENVREQIYSSLVNYHHIHVHLRDVEKQTEESISLEKTTAAQAAELEKEQMTLKESIIRNKEQDKTNKKRLHELQQQLAAAEAEKRKMGANMDVEEDDEDSVLCCCRIPLGDKNSIDYDEEMLKLVKSKFLDEKEPTHHSSDSAHNNVIRPLTSSELALATANLADGQRKLVWTALQKIDMWDYSVFDMQTAMGGNDIESMAYQPNGGSLFITTYALFFRHGLMQKFRIDERTLINWISVVEAGYHPNPYHNSMHAADVLHITHFILSKGGLIAKCSLTDEDIFASLFAAAIHDYDHPGINNSFHIKAQTYLATLYNDRSILENHHVSSVMELMKLPRFNLFSGMSEDQRRDIRETVIEMVLATDMGHHGKYVSQFKHRLQENHDFVKKEDIRLALSMAVKMADISNCGRPEYIYLRWSAKIADEFYLQGDRERNLGVPCSPFMDRMQPAMAKGQIAFMNYIVIPMFDCISELIPDMRFSVDLTEANKGYWAKHDDTVVAN
eukprot:Tbor_TRINITY_DN3045_c0_g1::TRINITY_DN3045_c0_g1_i1::g.17430::m.17430/K13755/PDE1; calcium/calmodulin-dependent 3',5'-cyclic nucleotide phosphodiesterase